MSGAKKKAQKKLEQPKEKVYTLTESQIKQMKSDATNEAMGQALILMLSLPCMVMRDKHGYGKKRMEQYVDDILDYWDSFNKGYITFDDCVKCLEEETGINIVDEGREKRLI